MESISTVQEFDIFQILGSNRVFRCLFVFENVIIFENEATLAVTIWQRDMDFIEVVILKSYY